MKAGSDQIIVHSESTYHLHRLVHQIKDQGAQVGVAINPATPLSALEETLVYVDIALIGSVKSRFGGQKLIPGNPGKDSRLRRVLAEGAYTREIQMDGGINADTAADCVRAGATILVAGSAIFNDRESVQDAMDRLRASIQGVEADP